MEPLSASTADEAREQARRLLADHASGIAAHVYLGDDCIHTIVAEEPAVAGA